MQGSVPMDEVRRAPSPRKLIPTEWGDLTRNVIAAAIEVHSWLGPGQLEHMYEEAMAVELGLKRLQFERQRPIRMKYKGVAIGDLRLDLVVERLLVVELKAIEAVAPVHVAQPTSYLRSADLPLGLLINFSHVRLIDGVSRRLNPYATLVRSLPDLLATPPLSSPPSLPSEFLPEDDQ